MPKKITKKSEIRRLDETWKKNIKEKDNYICQICRKKLEGKNCQAHHIIPKQLKKFRWDIDNGITLCYRCHKVGSYSPHMNAIWFTFWMKTNKIEQFRYILNKLKELNERDLNISNKLLSGVIGRKEK